MENTDTSTQVVGYVSLVLSCISFGTMFVPLNKSNCRDGFFVQWIECSVVFIVGCVFYAARGFPTFEPVMCIGGLLYATGNVFSVPIISGVGMGLGFLIWSSLQIIVGWGVARFGLFGLLQPQPVKIDWLNYVGIALVLISGVILIFVKHVSNDEPKNDVKSNVKKNILQMIPYILMAVVLACLHGLMMSPMDYVKQKNPSNDSFKVLDYIFPFYTSVFLFSTIYFLAYCIIMRRKAHIDRALIIPSIGYGILWTAGMTFWFLSSDKLSQVVAYPCTARLPPLISAALEVFIFKTIKGTRSFITLSISAIIGVIAVILIALSNQL